jgi:hypothetical protein
MTTMREVPIEPDLLELATGLGFTEVHQIHRNDGLGGLGPTSVKPVGKVLL